MVGELEAKRAAARAVARERKRKPTPSISKKKKFVSDVERIRKAGGVAIEARTGEILTRKEVTKRTRPTLQERIKIEAQAETLAKQTRKRLFEKKGFEVEETPTQIILRRKPEPTRFVGDITRAPKVTSLPGRITMFGERLQQRGIQEQFEKRRAIPRGIGGLKETAGSLIRGVGETISGEVTTESLLITGGLFAIGPALGAAAKIPTIAPRVAKGLVIGAKTARAIVPSAFGVVAAIEAPKVITQIQTAREPGVEARKTIGQLSKFALAGGLGARAGRVVVETGIKVTPRITEAGFVTKQIVTKGKIPSQMEIVGEFQARRFKVPKPVEPLPRPVRPLKTIPGKPFKDFIDPFEFLERGKPLVRRPVPKITRRVGRTIGAEVIEFPTGEKITRVRKLGAGVGRLPLREIIEPERGFVSQDVVREIRGRARKRPLRPARKPSLFISETGEFVFLKGKKGQLLLERPKVRRVPTALERVRGEEIGFERGFGERIVGRGLKPEARLGRAPVTVLERPPLFLVPTKVRVFPKVVSEVIPTQKRVVKLAPSVFPTVTSITKPADVIIPLQAPSVVKIPAVGIPTVPGLPTPLKPPKPPKLPRFPVERFPGVPSRFVPSPVPAPFFIPPFKLPLPSGGAGLGVVGRRKKAKRKFEFKPSLVALEFGIKGKKRKGLTGFEVRKIPI